MTVTQARAKWWYRVLESVLAFSSFGILGLIFVLSFFPTTLIWVSLFFILYGLFWIFKVALIAIYTVYTYKQLKRWEKVDWPYLLQKLDTGLPAAKKYLLDLADKYQTKLDWKEYILEQVDNLVEVNQRLKPKDVYQVALFTVYNEPSEVLIRSLEFINKAYIDKAKCLVVISQEEKNGTDKNKELRDKVGELDWVESKLIKPYDLEDVYQKHTQEFLQARKPKNFTKLELSSEKLNLFFTEHPGDLPGEIRGKASNEDWAARNLSLLLSDNQISADKVLITSLDSDSHIGTYFFANLTYKFLATKDRLETGYQPVHVYSNNFFKTGFWARQIATQTTLDNMSRVAMHEEAALFAIYSLPLSLLRKADFWERELIAEDILLTARCILATQGRFKVEAQYGILEGDAVEDEDYIDTIISQYKQLQRWSWGGVEVIPYLIQYFFIKHSGSLIDLRVRLKWVFLQFSNHFFWSTTPILFSVGIFFPQILASEDDKATQLAQSLSIFAQYYAWLSMIFLALFSFIVFRFITVKAGKHTKITWYSWYLIIFQILISPVFYLFMGIPALDAQLRGLLGKYLSYVVTPKK